MDEKALLQAIGQIMDSTLEPINVRLDTTQGDIKALDKKIDEVENRFYALVETKVTKKIDLLLDGHAELDERICQLRNLNDKVEDTQTTVEVLKHLSVKQ